jgi:peptidoglycan/LPS O-acetylase OafA/YrhL
MPNPSSNAPSTARFWWLDGIKGISILWIVFFHLFSAYNVRYPWTLSSGYFPKFMLSCGASNWIESAGCFLLSLFVGGSQVGFHAVGVFLVASGFGLCYSMAKPGKRHDGWLQWFRKRLTRLFPMYWLAHLIFLVSPFVSRPEPVDYRFLLSFLGDRIWPLEEIFFYANPAWWYFGLLIELYIVFPLLFRLLTRLGASYFLLIAALFTLLTRLLLLGVIPVHGYYLQGAFFGARLWEFAMGMALGFLCRKQPILVEKVLFARVTLLGGVVSYALGLWSYGGGWVYAFTDPLIGTGLFVILAHVAVWTCQVRQLASMVSYVGAFSYGLYLLHQPYVLYFGVLMRPFSMPVFLVLSLILIAALALCTIPLERGVDRLVRWITSRYSSQPVAVPAGTSLSKTDS